jgi:hypothetical protein
MSSVEIGHQQRTESLKIHWENKEFIFAGSFFVLCSALLAKHFDILSEAIFFRKINMVPTNKHQEDRKCKIPA